MSEPRVAEHFQDLARQTDAARLGMWVFLASELMLFAGVFALYAGYRAMYPVDFAAAVAHNDAAIGTANTIVLLTSSLLVATGVHAIRLGRAKLSALLVLGAVALGVAFLVIKGVEYARHFHEGIFPGPAYAFSGLPTFGARMFFSLYYLATGLHALHVTVGMVVLILVSRALWLGRYGPAYYTPLDLGGLYWHLVDVVWIFLWPMLYLMHD